MNNNLTFEGSPSSASRRTIEGQGYFIDDYSHLRLSYYQFRDGDDNSCHLRALHDDYSISTDREHRLESSSSQVLQDAAISDEESWGTSIISLLSTSPIYSSFEFVENPNDTETTQDSPGVRISTISEGTVQERTLDQTQLPAPVLEESWRTRLRNSFLSSNVILPHPSQVAAAMIASASQRAGGHQFRYNNKVEPESKVMINRDLAGSRVMVERECAGSRVMTERDCDDDIIVFDPKRRSTLKNNYSRLY